DESWRVERESFRKTHVRRWDVATGRSVAHHELKGDGSWVVIAPTGELVAQWDARPRSIKVWRTDNGQVVDRSQDLENDARGMVFSPDGRSLAFALKGGDMIVRDIVNGREWGRWSLAKRGSVETFINGPVYSPDGRFLAVQVDDVRPGDKSWEPSVI